MPSKLTIANCLQKVLFIFTGLLIVCNSAYAQFEFTGNRNRENIPFQLVKNLMVIPLKINGSGPYNFVLDTGVGLFLITDPALVDSIHIENLRSIKISGFGKGEDLSAFVAPSLEVDIGSAKAKSIAAAILKKDVFELSSFAGMPIHGLIGYEFFNSFTVRISYSLNSITIYRPDQFYIPRKGTRIPITIEEHKPYMVNELVLSTGQKVSAKLIIDTGAGHPISLESFEGKPFEVPQVNIAANLGIGLMGAIKGYIGRIPSVKIGKFTLKNVIAAYPSYEDVGSKVRSIQRNGSVGNNILRRFDVVFDYHRQSMYIKPSSFLKEPFEHDMSGMELASGGKDFKRVIITRIEPSSPAEEVGLNKDDEILSINFKSVTDMTMQEIDNLFRSRNDRSFILEVVPRGSKERERVILTLQRRI
ncbi:aspartyl protease family protein [Daejeonella oryzae]|uniref:aspartyl protease family protein n=1 Tax=Daejeonella oryzae TaxID=1122943 RepID=UPI000429138B|nr:aspartyl protease family protein [Daejeonella oryzae]